MTTPASAPPSGESFLLPLGDEESDGFWEGKAAGELRVQEFGSCGVLRFPSRVMCPECQSTERSRRAVWGRGITWSFVVVHPPVLPAYAPYVPFPVVTVTFGREAQPAHGGHLVAGPGGGPVRVVSPTASDSMASESLPARTGA